MSKFKYYLIACVICSILVGCLCIGISINMIIEYPYRDTSYDLFIISFGFFLGFFIPLFVYVDRKIRWVGIKRRNKK